MTAMKSCVPFLFAATLTLAFSAGCTSTQTVKPLPDINQLTLNNPDTMEDAVPLPSKWSQPYRNALDNLIGIYAVLAPDKTSPNGFAVRVLGRAITDAGVKAIQVKVFERGQPVYQSRVEGKFAGSLSFVVGNLNAEVDRLYDLCLNDEAAAFVPPDKKYLDKAKVLDVWETLPETYKDVIWVTGITHQTLTYKEYQKYMGRTDAAYTLIKENGEYYYGNELMGVAHVLYFTGLSDGALFGVLDPVSGLYRKKVIRMPKGIGMDTLAVERLFEGRSGRAPMPKATIDLFKATVARGKFEGM
jgi:hypothetical protein